MHFPSFSIRRLLPGLLRAVCIATVAALLGVAGRAQAQNLIQDPNFSMGFADYSTAGTVSPDSTTFPGITGADLGTYGIIQQTPISGYTAGVTYTLTFMAALTDPNAPTQLFAGFAPTCTGDCSSASILPTITSSTLTQYTLTATATAQGTPDLEFYNEGAGTVFITDLSLEGAPAPVAGSGLASSAVALAGLAAHRIRRRRWVTSA